VTVHVAQHPHVTGFTVLGEAEGGSELLGHATSFEDAQALADQASGCPQPCSCGPWADQANVLPADAPQQQDDARNARILYRASQTRTPAGDDEAPRTIRPTA